MFIRLICSFLIISLISSTLGAPKAGKHLLKNFPHGRIIGGTDANIEDFPYQVTVLWNGKPICSGSIIDSTHVLTAAHCTDGSYAIEFQIRAGSSIREQGGTVVDVKAIHQHPSFIRAEFDYDLSILELSSALSFGKGINSIDLASSELEIGSVVNVTGWGPTGWSPTDQPLHLQVISIEIVSQKICRSAYGYSSITDRMICAGVNGGVKNFCADDVGGPLVSNGVQYGIASLSYGCPEGRFPGAYSDVASLRDYIDSVVD